MSIKVSVVIPVYNVERTLNRCIDSVISQTMKDFEIILVNDGSTDSSARICNDYASKYQNIIVYHKENEGLGPTRNLGVIKAKGEYIYHCDSDDWIEPDLLYVAYNKAKENNSDVVIFGYKIYQNNNNVLLKHSIVSDENQQLLNSQKIREYFIQSLNNSYFTQSVCNKLIKKEFLEKNNILFKPFRRSQDVVFSVELFDKLQNLSIIKDAYYNYVIEPGKFKGRSFEEMIRIYLDVHEELKKYIVKWGLYNTKSQNLLSVLYIGHISNYVSFFVARKDTKNKTKLIRDVINNNEIQTLFQQVKNKNFESRFLRFSHYSITNRRVYLTKLVLKVHQLKQLFYGLKK